MCKKKNIYIYTVYIYIYVCAGQYTVDLINNNIRRNVQTGCTGYLHSSNTNGRKMINNLLIISDY